MKTHSHVGVVKETVTLVFENGYALTFTAGSKVALHVVEAAQQSAQADGETEAMLECGHPAKYTVYGQTRNWCAICHQNAVPKGVLFGPSHRR